MTVVINGSVGVNTPGVTTGAISIGVIGSRRNMISELDATSNNVSFTADSHILSDGNGNYAQVPLSSTIDVSTLGIGGFVTPPAPNSWVVIYHVHNPSNGSSGLIGDTVNLATRTPETMPVAKLPSGYTFSAVVCFIKLAPTSQFRPHNLRDRTFYGGAAPDVELVSFTGTSAGMDTLFNVSSYIPLNITGMYVTAYFTSVTGYPATMGWDMEAVVRSGPSELRTNGTAVSVGGVAASGRIANNLARSIRIKVTTPPTPVTPHVNLWLLGYEF